MEIAKMWFVINEGFDQNSRNEDHERMVSNALVKR